MKYKTNLEKWEATGLLVELTEDRKMKIADWFEYALQKIGDIDLDDTKMVIFPIIRRVGVVVDITYDDIDKIITYVNETFKSRMESLMGKFEYMNNIDYECELIAMYSDEKIIEIQNRNKNE